MEDKLTSSIESIMTNVTLNGYSDETLGSVRKELDMTNSVLELTDLQTVLFSVILEISYNSYATIKEITDRLSISNIRFIGMHDDIEKLKKMRYITEGRSESDNVVYRVPYNTLKSIQENHRPDQSDIKNLTTRSLFKRLMKLFRAMSVENITALQTLNECLDLMNHNLGTNSFVKKCVEWGLFKMNGTNQLLTFYMMHRRQFFGEEEFSPRELKGIVESSPLDDEEILAGLENEESELFKKGMIEYYCDNGVVDNKRIILKEQFQKEILDEVIQDEKKWEEPNMNVPKDELIKAEEIEEKQLFYNNTEWEQLKKIEDLLDKENFPKVQERLHEKHLAKGFVALFYGGPGTGKTASVMELARKSGRDVYFVDQSKLRSKWHGESEKALKKMFAQYRRWVRTSTVCPILVLNECDSMMYRRTENLNSSNDQLNNSLVNIILNELETFEGILLATSNLAGGMDEAFERRILFKVKFDKPQEEVRSKIWRSKIEELEQESVAELAEKYDFSGGQIENVARKVNIDYVLTGRMSSLEEIKKDCEQETIQNGRIPKIGFQIHGENLN